MTAEDHTEAAVHRWQCTITAEGRVTVSPIDLLWNFFILSGLQPQPQQRLLAYQRAQALRALEKRDHSRAITLIHRREKLAFLGFGAGLARQPSVTQLDHSGVAVRQVGLQSASCGAAPRRSRVAIRSTVASNASTFSCEQVEEILTDT